MFRIEYYEDEQGRSDIRDFLVSLNKRAKNSKNARINRNKVVAYIDLLEEYGTRIGKPVTKHLDGDIWELRPLANRILYAYHEENTFVLLHHFKKDTRKTPKREIEKAKNELDEYRKRGGNNG